jgi:hypothetical protein
VNDGVKHWQVPQAQRSSGAALAAAMKRRLTWYGGLSNGAGPVFVLGLTVTPAEAEDTRLSSFSAPRETPA